jgi:hypothetical protein
MALHQLSVGRFAGRSIDACAFAGPASGSISASSDARVPIFARNGASLSPKCRPFFGARVASVSGQCLSQLCVFVDSRRFSEGC